MMSILTKVQFGDVSVRYFSSEGETEALRGIDFSIRAGEFVAIVGQSGCGKSTLLSLLSGLVQPTSGEVRINGDLITGPTRQSAFMLQQDTLFEWRTVLQNVILGPEIHGDDISEARTRAALLLERYGLGEFKDHFPNQLSGGMRQRVALARTLCSGPDILLLDEPFSALDFQTRLKLADEVATIIRNEEKTTLLVTHDISEAISMADRVIVLTSRPGRITADHRVSFTDGDGRRLTPFEAREKPEFSRYFNLIWQELESGNAHEQSRG